MPAFDFPASPSDGTEYAPAGGPIYVYQSPVWKVKTAPTASAYDVGRNLIHNSMFTIAQRGVGPFTASLAYTADRWQAFAANDTISVSVGVLGDADRTSIGDEAAAQALAYQFTGSATAGSRCTVFQQVEDVRRLGGKTVALSFWAKGIVGTPKVAVTISQNFGTGGSPSATVLTSLGATAALSSAWTRYTFTAALPSVVGKTLGTIPDSKTGVNFYFSDQANSSGGAIGVQSGTVALWGVQLEVGSTATPLEKPDLDVQLRQCQRFYQYFLGVLCAGNAGTGIQFHSDFSFLQQMRAVPTVTFANASYNNANTITVNNVGVNHIRLGTTSTGGGYGYGLADLLLAADL
jgi:hypothetical protein